MASPMIQCRWVMLKPLLKHAARGIHRGSRNKVVRSTTQIQGIHPLPGPSITTQAYTTQQLSSPAYTQKKRPGTPVQPTRRCSVDVSESTIKSLLGNTLKERSPHELSAEEIFLVFTELEASFYDSLSHVPWLQRNIHIGFIQLLLSDNLTTLPAPIWEHTQMEPLLQRLKEVSPNLSDIQLTYTLRSLLYLGLMYSPHMETILPTLLTLCRDRVSGFDLEALGVLVGIQSRMFQRDWVSMQKQIHRFSQLLDDPGMDWTPENIVHLCSATIDVAGLPLSSVKLHGEKPLEKLLHLLPDERYLDDPDTICLYLRLARKLFLSPGLDQSKALRLISIASDACLRHMDKFDVHNIAEGCAALRQSRCFSSDLMAAFRQRSLELLGDDLKLSDVSNLFYSINQHTPLDIKRRYESAIFQRLDVDVDVVIISNLAENLATVNVKNVDLLLAFQSLMARKAYKLASYATRFNKIVRFLNRKPFILSEHDSMFKESVLEVLDKEFKMSSLALFTLYLLPSTTVALSDAFIKRIMTGIPKLRASDHHRIALGINQMRLPMTSQLRKQVATIQAALSEQMIKKSEDISSLDYLYQITMEIVVHNKKRDPMLTTHFMEMFPRFTKSINDVSLIKVLAVFHEMAYYLPEVYDDLVAFAIDNAESTQVEKLVFLLSALARVGYTPKRFDEFCSVMMDAYAEMEKEGNLRQQLLMMRSLNILQVYPERELLDIFSIDFIERLDRLIEERPLQKFSFEQTMMVLNRNVLLECPQLDIPWFHEQYLEQNLKREPEKPSSARRFKDDVASVLMDPEILGNLRNMRRHLHSQYGYLINFECILNHKNEAIPPEDFKDVVLPVDWQRIAILTLTESSYTSNSRLLLGSEQLRWRHLEIMGYKVVEVPYFEWYSMGLSDYHAKVDFLSNKIFNS